MKKIALLLVLMAFISLNAYSQKTNNVINLSGKVVDENNKPLGTDIYFTDSKGEKKSCKANSKDGSYSTVLNPDTYNITVRNYIVTDKSTLVLPNKGAYSEINYNFQVIKLTVGMEIKRFNPFTSNSEELKSSDFNEIIAFMQSNKTTNIEFSINANDCSFKPIKKKIKVEGKKKATTKEVTISNDEQAKEFLDKRKAKITEYLTSKGVPERSFSFEYASKYTPSQAPKADKKSKAGKDTPAIKSNNSTVTAKISKVGL